MWPTGETQNSLQIFSHFWEEVKSLVSLSTRRAGTHSTPKEKVQGPAQGDRYVGKKKEKKNLKLSSSYWVLVCQSWEYLGANKSAV